MTAAQSLKIFEILGKHFNNKEDAKIVVTEIEQIIENKIDAKRDVLATKEDIAAIKIEIVNTKTDLLKWIVSLFLSLFVTMGLMIIGLYFKK